MRRSSRSRGQAALEFLTTYGWALSVTLLAVATLSYFGVVNVDALVPEKCVFSPGIGCKDFMLAAPGAGPEVTLLLQNNLNRPVVLQQGSMDIQCDSCGVDPANEADCYTFMDEAGGAHQLATDDITMRTGEVLRLECIDGAQTYLDFSGSSGSKTRIRIAFDYVPVGQTFKHHVEGEVYATVR